MNHRLLFLLFFVLSVALLASCTDNVKPGDDDAVAIDAVDDSTQNTDATLLDTLAADTAPDAIRHECDVDSDCGQCGVCADVGGRQCLEVGASECVVDADCAAFSVCLPFHPDQRECGGRCQFVGEPAPYVVHEWGVNLTGTDGTSQLASTPEQYHGAVPMKPVVYVYSEDARQLDVQVDFASGNSTDTWPARPNAPTVSWSGVQVHNGPCEPTPSPMPGMDEPWRELFELPNWIVPDASCLVVDGVVSKLLFYTGILERYETPLLIEARIESVDQGDLVRFEVTNRSAEAIGPVMLMYRDALGSCMDPSWCPVQSAELAWTTLEQIAPGTTEVVYEVIWNLEAGSTGEVVVPASWNAQAETLRALLVAKGLYAAEAQVFLDAWEPLLFGVHSSDIVYSLPGYSNGAFALYAWSDAHAAEQLALTLTPPPQELSRAIIEYQPIAMVPHLTAVVEGKVELVEYDSNPGVPVYTGPAAGAIVAAYQGAALIAETVADEAGLYSLALPAGDYELRASRNEGETGDTKNVQVSVGETLSNIDFQLSSTAMAYKPNLYLYPTQTTQVQVELGLHAGCEVTVSIPEYGAGWDVEVEPSGLIDGQHTFLFYEAEVPRRFPMQQGWMIPAAEVEPFFSQVMNLYGFTAAEILDFVDYWKDHLPNAPYYAVYPLTAAEDLEPLVLLDIQPKPDSLFRLWFVVSPEAAPIPMLPARVERMTRQGFAAVEWGVVLD